MNVVVWPMRRPFIGGGSASAACACRGTATAPASAPAPCTLRSPDYSLIQVRANVMELYLKIENLIYLNLMYFLPSKLAF